MVTPPLGTYLSSALGTVLPLVFSPGWVLGGCLVSGFWFLVLHRAGLGRILVSGFWFCARQVLGGFWFLVSGFWFCAGWVLGGFWFLVSGFATGGS